MQDGHDAVRFFVRQWAKQNTVDHTEYGRGGSDAQRQREHGHDCEAGVLKQLTEGAAQIVKHGREIVNRAQCSEERPIPVCHGANQKYGWDRST